MDMKLHNTVLGMLSVVPDAAPVLQANLRKIMKDNIEGVSLEDCELALEPVNKQWAALMVGIYGTHNYNIDLESEYKVGDR